MPLSDSIPTHHITLTEKANLALRLHPYQSNDRLRASYPHRHSFYEIHFITGGSGQHVIDFEYYTIKAPIVFFISPGQVHYFLEDKPLLGDVLIFNADFLSLTSHYDNLIHDLAFFHQAPADKPLYLNRQSVGDVLDLLEMLRGECEHEGFQRDRAARAYLTVLMIKLQRLFTQNTYSHKRRAALHLSQRFRSLVTKHYLKERSVATYAKKLNISNGHLHAIIKETLDTSPGQFIRNEVMLEAKRLLTHTKLSIKQIAHYLQFDDPSYFARSFKREVGLSPSDFRQKHNDFITPS